MECGTHASVNHVSRGAHLAPRKRRARHALQDWSSTLSTSYIVHRKKCCYLRRDRAFAELAAPRDLSSWAAIATGRKRRKVVPHDTTLQLDARTFLRYRYAPISGCYQHASRATPEEVDVASVIY